jgi:hypothetical protein
VGIGNRNGTKGGGRMIYLVLLLALVGFVAACVDNAMMNWEEESDDPR